MKINILSLILIISMVASVACSKQNDTSGVNADVEAETQTDGKAEADTGAESGDGTEQTGSESRGYTVLAEKLLIPWAIAFDGDTVYISERAGSIVKIEEGAVTRQPVRLKKNTKNEGEGGFLGFVLAPDFAKTRQAYAYHSYEESASILNRIVLLEEKDDGWEEVKAYIENIPGSYIHDGGRMAIGPDNHLYITTGDAGIRELPQDRNSLAGKILRMTLDGKIPADNPFPNSYVYSYGHRNSQGIDWNDEGIMYSSEHGPSGTPGGHDELNVIEPGGNYGWPNIIGDEQGEGMTTPIYHTGDEAIAPSGIAIDSENRILVAALRGQKLFRYDPKDKTMEALLEHEGRLRDVKIHNGKIYVITNNTDGRGNPSEGDDRLLVLK
ncbi:PQQ-dependent sugar dehydrogenase [Paenibacillus alkalitolerans]|uniref:PQQ-dependent sugar dehydrogenase n=1 Tax=Paenibacillus alkalitolerans TaxID=2799335 RepID=UPI001F43C93A|nr:PQQ-dependent sugar dehydrogenase [Paenibacillus alkalitolerans]